MASMFPSSLFEPSAKYCRALDSINSKSAIGENGFQVNGTTTSSITNARPAAVAAFSVREKAQVYSPFRFIANSTAEATKKIALHSPEYYQACAIGGMLSCGMTHLAVTPLDVVKCNMQTDPTKYTGIFQGFGAVIKHEGAGALLKGWLPTAIGYSAQGACKFGFYEFFKKYYSDLAGAENAKKYETGIYLAGSASAEFIADVALCPWEAVKVRVQTTPGFAQGLFDGMPKIIQQEGFGGLFKGLVPLWGRQIPYTMMKFACFEKTVQALYAHVIPKPKEECNKTEQLGVSFLAGYIAGVFCAVVSHPADNLVSKLNSSNTATVGSVVAEMGMWNLMTRGLTLRIIMIGTLTGLQWGIYDAYKVSVGLYVLFKYVVDGWLIKFTWFTKIAENL